MPLLFYGAQNCLEKASSSPQVPTHGQLPAFTSPPGRRNGQPRSCATAHGYHSTVGTLTVAAAIKATEWNVRPRGSRTRPHANTVSWRVRWRPWPDPASAGQPAQSRGARKSGVRYSGPRAICIRQDAYQPTRPSSMEPSGNQGLSVADGMAMAGVPTSTFPRRIFIQVSSCHCW